MGSRPRSGWRHWPCRRRAGRPAAPPLGQRLVAEGAAGRDLAQRGPDALLERRAGRDQRQVERLSAAARSSRPAAPAAARATGAVQPPPGRRRRRARTSSWVGSIGRSVNSSRQMPSSVAPASRLPSGLRSMVTTTDVAPDRRRRVARAARSSGRRRSARRCSAAVGRGRGGLERPAAQAWPVAGEERLPGGGEALDVARQRRWRRAASAAEDVGGAHGGDGLVHEIPRLGRLRWMKRSDPPEA